MGESGAGEGARPPADPEPGPDAEAARLLPFLAPGARADLQAAAARHVLGLTGTGPGRSLLAGQAGLLRALAELAAALEAAPARDAARALVNLAADPGLHARLLAADPALPARLLSRMLDPQWPWADEAAAALANLSREPAPCAALMAALASVGPDSAGLERLVRALCTPGYNARASLHYLGPLLSNLSQQPAARAFLLDPDRCVLHRLLPLTQFPDSSLRRGGVVGTLRNCCFEHRHHEWLLGPQVDILPYLLLPLAGPEDFPEEEMERLPVDLQYLPPDKQREPDAVIRKMLIEAIMLLTATAPGRQQVRDQGAYLILRELHSQEQEPNVRVACEKLIQVLIGDEPERGMENLLEVQVPEAVEQQLQQLDFQEQEQLEREQREQAREPDREGPPRPVSSSDLTLLTGSSRSSLATSCSTRPSGLVLGVIYNPRRVVMASTGVRAFAGESESRKFALGRRLRRRRVAPNRQMRRSRGDGAWRGRAESEAELEGGVRPTGDSSGKRGVAGTPLGEPGGSAGLRLGAYGEGAQSGAPPEAGGRRRRRERLAAAPTSGVPAALQPEEKPRDSLLSSSGASTRDPPRIVLRGPARAAGSTLSLRPASEGARGRRPWAGFHHGDPDSDSQEQWLTRQPNRERRSANLPGQ
ncbi:protein HGH1 homolog [Ctenodactylus gundi]